MFLLKTCIGIHLTFTQARMWACLCCGLWNCRFKLRRGVQLCCGQCDVLLCATELCGQCDVLLCATELCGQCDVLLCATELCGQCDVLLCATDLCGQWDVLQIATELCRTAVDSVMCYSALQNCVGLRFAAFVFFRCLSKTAKSEC